MRQRYSQITTTESVKRAQRRYGVERPVAGAHPEGEVRLTERETEFIAARDSFYLATVSDTGWPYVQHRGGPVGFLRVIDEHTIAYADLRGNRQLISRGNLAANDRVALILVDYPNRARLKIVGHARVVGRDGPPAILAALDPALLKKAERVVLIDVVGFDWNCPQQITPRFTEAEVAAATAPLREKIAELERRLAER